VLIPLWDERKMPIESKVSNSGVNSIKRLNNDAAVKAGKWIHYFGAECAQHAFGPFGWDRSG
jgi:hypothetical protein